MNRFEEAIKPLVDELEAWLDWYDALSPEDKAKEDARREFEMEQWFGFGAGPCVQGPDFEEGDERAWRRH